MSIRGSPRTRNRGSAKSTWYQNTRERVRALFQSQERDRDAALGVLQMGDARNQQDALLIARYLWTLRFFQEVSLSVRLELARHVIVKEYDAEDTGAFRGARGPPARHSDWQCPVRGVQCTGLSLIGTATPMPCAVYRQGSSISQVGVAAGSAPPSQESAPLGRCGTH